MKVTITLRDKTTKRLDKATCQTLREVISQGITSNTKELERLIWKLTYNPKKTGQELGFKEIEQEEATTIRAEMVNFFRLFKSDWTYGSEYSAQMAEEKELLKALKGDLYAYDMVMKHIVARVEFPKEEVDRILRCLNSARETSQYGGVRSLGFRAEEADFLKGAANAMGKVLEAMTAK